ncbi:hypothetical protein AAZX31_20G009800 [Glycine max]|uniref:Calmodulin-binding protein n=2 Tax=Glycine subgen. Soja TaxID=1462606 RepID=I1ND40_SOYBN|nr:uncharacterized protein LOC100809335 [Glycine max]XP_028221157.1 uncharacterized protein LOC114402702 [Glycine soja]KAG4906237.1 hypothetical protein JHK86_054721 [Glycine max]KAG4908839.1 hypothetical protein JHK87_054955 [Glycine soja]KAG4917397.1 hypothetical protein JHK85_055678 [Glycine max]KAG5073518.1 hypothetical protein JHK84_054749 [Glycine max]KAH1033993.1 hypothetical protein GYH30_054414 [Glycine max]|eukprot:XP_003556635.1 uncharacterized protein LOC100809335 [Glycine max]
MEVVVAVPPPPPPSSSMDFNFDSNCSSPYITAPSSPQRFGNFFFSAPTSPTRRHSSASTPNTTQDEFEFDFSGHLQRPSLSAEELFLGGKIRPLKPLSPSSSRRREKRVIQESPPSQQRKLGKERASSFSVSSTTFSLGDKSNSSKTSESISNSSFLSSISFGKGYRKWRLKDFLLFRSASEGRASDKDPFRKYAVLSKTTAHEDVRNVSSGSVSRRRGPVSAHELHYTVNRAASVELKKKTLLPYKQGFLGCLAFNPAMHGS